jgi:beta-mannosidase
MGAVPKIDALPVRSQAIDLAGQWALAQVDGGMAAPFRVPGDVHSALHESGLIPDPYFGRNEYDLRWIVDRDWTITRDFDLPADALLRGWVLELDRLDTVAEVRLNGEPVLSADNAFRRHRINVDRALRHGGNHLEITIRSATAEANRRQAAQPWRVPYSTANSPIPNGNMLRKTQCHFGWDWNIALAPLGLYGAARLVHTPDALLDHVLVRQVHEAGRVRVEVEIAVERRSAATVPWSVSFAGQARAGALDLSRGGKAVAEFVVDHPELWWPAGLGPQTLHDLVVSVAGMEERRRVGLRDIRLVSEPDEAGRGFKFAVNGRDVFCRGANWIPSDALPGREDREATRGLLQSAVDANMNMIRVWGGGQYEPDWFYDLCDELGLMVWQDFMLSCNLYPADEAFLAEIAAEVRENVARLQHHASIALWCGDNELIGALTWFEESRKNRDRYLVMYDRLNRTVEQALKSVDPSANWWPSSPSPGPMSFCDAWHDDSSGDMHFWSVWHEGRNFEHYRDVRPRFCSEFGFQSYPSMDVVRRFAKPEDMNIASPVMEAHQKNAGGNARIAETMFRTFRFPSSFADFVYLSQVQQGLAIRTAVEWWRSLKPHCMGTLYWQLNDTWPVASWSGLDHGGGWKGLHHMARRFFAPVAAFVIPDKAGNFVVHAMNDGREAVDIEVVVDAVSMDGATTPLARFAGKMGTDAAAALGTVEAAKVPAGCVLAFRWTASDGSAGSDHVSPVPYKMLDLADPQVAVAARRDGGRILLDLSARKPAFFVALEAPVAGRFADNFFTLLPGESRTVEFFPRQPLADLGGFACRDLFNSTR